MHSTVIHDDTLPGIARVIIYDHNGRATRIGRYQIFKERCHPNGRYIQSFVYRHQKPAAIEHARKWLAQLSTEPAASKCK